MFKVNNFEKYFEKMLKIFVISTTKIILPRATGQFFQHRLIDFIHTNATNPFSNLTNGEKVMNSRYKLFILFANNCASSWQPFSVIFIPSGSERKDFSAQTDLFHSYQYNEPIFKVDKRRKSYEKSLQIFHAICEKYCVAMTTFQRHIHSIRLRTERFFNTN